MAETESPEQKSDPTNRWWVDSSGKGRKAQPVVPKPTTTGSRFFIAGNGFSQEPARDRLTDNNLKIVKQAAPEEGAWTVVQLADGPSFSERERERITREVALPPYARGVIVDCGRSVRLLVTGTPIGERLLDLTLNEAPSFDCWIRDEWVREEVFKDANAAIRAFKRLIPEYLSAEAIRLAEEISARA